MKSALLLLATLLMVCSAAFAQQYTPEQRAALEKSNPDMLADPDKDGVPSGLDRCQNVAGKIEGCPETTTAVEEDWQTVVTGMQNKLFARMDSLWQHEQRRHALQEYATAIKARFPSAGTAVFAYAIQPVLFKRARGNASLEDIFITTWNEMTGFPVSAMREMLPAKAAPAVAPAAVVTRPAAAQPAADVSSREERFPPGTLVRLKERVYFLDFRKNGGDTVLVVTANGSNYGVIPMHHNNSRPANKPDYVRPQYFNVATRNQMDAGQIISGKFKVCDYCYGSCKMIRTDTETTGGHKESINFNTTLTHGTYTTTTTAIVSCGNCAGKGCFAL